MTMTTIFEVLKGFSMKGEDFELELAMLIHDSEREVKLKENTSFAKEVSILLNTKGRSKNRHQALWHPNPPGTPWEKSFGVIYDDEIPF